LQIGIGVPGIVDHELGIVRNAVNVGLAEVALAHRIASAIDAPTTIDNDVNAATLGAVRVFAPSQSGSLAFLNVGTGLAAGLYTHGRLMRGRAGLTGELGHLPSRDLSSERCGCGSHGCLETIASGHALALAWQDRSIEFSVALAEGHREALTIWNRLITGVVRALEVITLMWDPHTIVVGGGVARHHHRFAHDLTASWSELTASSSLLASPTVVDRVQIADPETPLGALGAALLGNEGLSPASGLANA
jgi:predicted NBD/HSP70 family sugar kinase